MRRHLHLLLLGLSLASPTRAAGVDIAWDNCRGEPGAASLKEFACNINPGAELLFVSFESAISAPSMGRFEVAIEFQTRNGGTLPVWWDFEDLASCRRGALSVKVDAPFETPTCARIFTSTQPAWVVDRIDYMLPTPDAGRMVVAANVSGPLVANQRYLACVFSLTHAKTSTCSGCDVPVVVTVTAVRPDGIIISNPLNQNFVYWQQTQPTPTRATTWGALKGLYR